MFEPNNYSTRSQDLIEARHDAGQFYFAKLSAVISETSAMSSTSSMLILPRERVLDIDTEEDFYLAERLFKVGLS